MRFKLRQMEVFRAVILTGSMSGAARMLNISQPAISRVVAHTEQSLGLRLFERASGRLVPTAEAQLLIGEVEKLYQGALRIDDFARELARRPGGTLTIAASPSLAIHAIPAVIARFLTAHPQVHVSYHTTLLADMARELVSRRANLAISVLPVEDPGITCEPLGTRRMVCLIPAGHALAGRPQVALAEVAAEPLVMYDRAIPFGRIIAAEFEKAGVAPRIVMEVPRGELAIAMVRAGIGLAIVDEFAVEGGAPPGTAVAAIAEPIRITLSLLQSRYGPPDGQNARVFIDMLKARFRKAG